MKLENKIAEKNIHVFDLEKYYPKTEDIIRFDIKPFLYKELVLKEDEFRTDIDTIDWQQYATKNVVVYCSNQAIIPLWAFMIIASHLSAVGAFLFKDDISLEESVLISNLKKIEFASFQDERIIIKGCSHKNISPYAYMVISQLFQPIAKAISFGEACSTVPIYRP